MQPRHTMIQRAMLNPMTVWAISGLLTIALIMILATPVHAQYGASPSWDLINVGPIPIGSLRTSPTPPGQWAICGGGDRCDGRQAEEETPAPRTTPAPKEETDSWSRSISSTDTGEEARREWGLYEQSPVRRAPDPVKGWRERYAANEGGKGPYFTLSAQSSNR